METSFLKKSHSFTNKLSRAKRNISVTYDDIKSPDDIRWLDGTKQTNRGASEKHTSGIDKKFSFRSHIQGSKGETYWKIRPKFEKKILSTCWVKIVFRFDELFYIISNEASEIIRK